jgi:hypothetical protein
MALAVAESQQHLEFDLLCSSLPLAQQHRFCQQHKLILAESGFEFANPVAHFGHYFPEPEQY